MKYFVANWKMYCSPEQSVGLAQAYQEIVVPAGIEAIVAPTALSFVQTAQTLRSTDWELAAQNVTWTPQGAYTGAISAEFFAEAGARYALVGHSERRHIFGEDNEDITKKLAAILASGVTPILCIGETAEDLADKKQQYRLKRQLEVLNTIPPESKFLIAYEPVWAISGSGEGKACLPADVEDVHGFIRRELATMGFVETSILYGGSVTPENAASYMSVPEVAGVLIGSASIHPEAVASILHTLDT